MLFSIGNKKKAWNRRLTGNVWKIKNKKWVVLTTSGALGGVAIVWDALRFKCHEVVLGSFSVTMKLESKDEGSLWLSLVCGQCSSFF